MNPWTLVWIWAIGAILMFCGGLVLLGFVRARINGDPLDGKDVVAIIGASVLWWLVLPLSGAVMGGVIAAEWLFDLGASLARRTEKKENT